MANGNVVIGNSTRIWELNLQWPLYSQCGVWDVRGRGVDVWECIKDRKFRPFIMLICCQLTTLPLQMNLRRVLNLPTLHTGDTSRVGSVQLASFHISFLYTLSSPTAHLPRFLRRTEHISPSPWLFIIFDTSSNRHSGPFSASQTWKMLLAIATPRRHS